MLPPETESVEENANEPVDSPEEESEQEEIPDAENDWELAGDEIPGIPIPDDWVEDVSEPDQEPDQWPDGDWADPEDLASEEISEIPIPDDWVEVVEEPDQEPENIPEQESDQWPQGDWADPEDLAGEEISEIPLPDDMVEIIEEPDQEPENIPELDPDQWSEGDWADPEDLAGEEIYPIPIPDDWVEIVEETDQEPIESPIQEENQEKEEIIVYATSENSSSDFLELKNSIAEIATQEKSQDIQKSQEITTENQESKRELNSKKDEKEANKELKETKEKDFNINKETNKVKAEIKKGEEISSDTQDEKTQEISKELKEKYKEQTGKRPIYAGKTTKGFEEWLKEQQESEKQDQEKKEYEEIKEDWEILLEKWINDADENEISKEVKDELIEIIKKYRNLRELEKILMVLLAKPNPTEGEIIEIEKLIDKVSELTEYLEGLFIAFERFKTFYNRNIIWFKERITEQKTRFVKHLAQKLRRLKETTSDENSLLNYNWKTNIKEKMDSIKDLNEIDKQLIAQIINKSDISEEERRKLISILTKLDTENLIQIFGEPFKHYTKNYIRWGWDFDQGLRKLILSNFFTRLDIYKKELTDMVSIRGINTIKKFPRKARLIISLAIFNCLSQNNENIISTYQDIVEYLIKSLKIEHFRSEWVNKIPRMELDNLSKKVHNKNEIDALKFYFKDLVMLINELNLKNIEIKKTGNIFNIKRFVSRLINKKVTLGLSRRTLLSFISELIDYLNDNSDEFKTEKLNFQILYDNGYRKECGQCHEIKSYSEFNKKSEHSLESKCKECRLEEEAIRKYKKKIFALLKLLGSKSKIKCNECKTDLTKLSALEFHHNDKRIKKTSLGDIFNKNLNKIIKVLEKENVSLLCANCHSKKQVKIFKKFQKLILRNDLFENTPDEIDKIINSFIETSLDLRELTPSKRSSFKTQIKRWLKKRFIIENLYNGKCIGCGEIHIQDNLPSFDFHHRNENLIKKKSRWNEINKFDILKIIKILKEEECVALCSNCHRIITHFRFIKHIDEIFGKEYKDIKEKAKSNYINIVRNTDNFKFKNIRINDPLKKEFEYGEGWKKYITLIYELIIKKNNNEFSSNELTEFMGHNKEAINRFLKKLVNMGLIELKKDTKKIKKGNLIYGDLPRIYRLTEKGYNESLKLIK